MADHLVTGITGVRIVCGNGRCGTTWEQNHHPEDRMSWNVCPNCLWAAPTNIAWDLRDDYLMRDTAHISEREDT